MRMAAIAGGELIGAGTNAAHLAQIIAVRTKDDHTMVAIAVGDVDAAHLTGDRVRVGIDRDRRREVQEGMTVASLRWGAIGTGTGTAREVGSVADELGSDLEQHNAAVVGVLLNHAIAIAADPDVVLVIDITAVHAVWQDGVLACIWLSGGNQRRIAPCINHVAGGIELDHRWRRPRFKGPTQRSCAGVRSADTFRRRQTAILKAACHYKNVVLRVDTGATDLTGYPSIRQWLGPVRIDCHQRRIEPRGFEAPEGGEDRQWERQRSSMTIALEIHCLSPP